MSRHELAEGQGDVDSVACYDYRRDPQEMVLCPDGAAVFLWLPGETPAWLEPGNAIRLARLLCTAADVADRSAAPPCRTPIYPQ